MLNLIIILSLSYLMTRLKMAQCELIREMLKDKEYTLVVNTENSGSPFRQWEKGFQLAKGKYFG